MSSATFEANNQAYLKAGLVWLRACLKARAPTAGSSAAPAAAAAPAEAKWWKIGSRPPEEPILLLPPPPTPDVVAARAALDAAKNTQPAPALIELAARLGLSSFETDILLFSAAMEIDPDLPGLVAAAHGNSDRRAPTYALAMSLFSEAAWDVLSPTRPLRALRLLEVHQSGSTPLLTAPLRIDERIASYIKGLNYLDERLSAQAAVVHAPTQLPPSQQSVAGALAKWLADTVHGHMVQVTGIDELAIRDVVATAANQAGRILLALHADSLPTSVEDTEHFVRLWMREAALLPIAILIQGADNPTTSNNSRRLGVFQKVGAPVLVAANEVIAGLDESVVVTVSPPPAAEREALWRNALRAAGHPDPASESLSRLASEFSLSSSRIEALAVGAVSVTPKDEDAVSAAWNVCVAHTASALDGIAQRVIPKATIDDLKLPPNEKLQLERLIEHARHRAKAVCEYGFDERSNRGLGIAALFHGESGAGKTMAAEAVAGALSLALFRVDLSSMVSKWVGETAKNMRRAFDGADRGGAVLLFDEAEGAFGQRREAKDSLDRHANLDTDYLLTRMESFRGVAILATNIKSAIDPAFMRRLRYIVAFPFPGVAERKAIWANVFPQAARATDLDLDKLARFTLTGGSIFNCALAAAHSAAAQSSPVTMDHVLDAVKWELRKIERPVVEREFARPAQVSKPKADAAA